MAVSYMKLWHLLLNRNMEKKELAEKTGIYECVTGERGMQ